MRHSTSLSPENRLKLYEIERIALRGTDLSPGDLLHEALCAAIMGDRKCPRDVPFMAFIVQTMRSIASHHREKRRREPADGGAAQEAQGGPAGVFDRYVRSGADAASNENRRTRSALSMTASRATSRLRWLSSVGQKGTAARNCGISSA